MRKKMEADSLSLSLRNMALKDMIEIEGLESLKKLKILDLKKGTEVEVQAAKSAAEDYYIAQITKKGATIKALFNLSLVAPIQDINGMLFACKSRFGAPLISHSSVRTARQAGVGAPRSTR